MELQAELRSVMREGIRALARADAPRLTELAKQVEAGGGMRAPETEAGREEALRLRRALGRLLALTRRNLRLLRVAGGAGGVGTDYGVRRC